MNEEVTQSVPLGSKAWENLTYERLSTKKKVGKPIDPKYKLFHFHAEKIINANPSLKSSEVIEKIKSVKEDMANTTPFFVEEHFQIPKAKQPFKIIASYREKLSYINRMIPRLEKKLDEITLLLREMNK